MTSTSVLPYCLPYMVLLLSVWSHTSAIPYITLLPTCIVWIGVPALDYLLGQFNTPTDSLTREERRELENRLDFRLIVYFWCPSQLTFLIWASHRISNPSLTTLDCIALTLTMGLIAAEGINCSHELLHRRSTFERSIGHLLLILVCYGHFSIEHTLGHHKRVATREDPATFRTDESFYAFLPRTVFGGYASAWRIEADRLRTAALPVFSGHNKMLKYFVASMLVIMAFHFGIGPRATVFFLAQAVLAVILLEQINAMEHYGLRRAKMKNGEFEPVGPQHSWDTTHLLSNFLLFKLQNHADHHLHALRRYQVLEVKEESPKLPAGYLTLGPLLFIPPLWRAVMDPILEAHIRNRGEETLYNVESRCKAS